MARRKLTTDEEQRLREEAERVRTDQGLWEDYRPAKVVRGKNPTAVLSVRVPLSQLRGLRAIAGQQGRSLSDVLKDAVDAYVAASGPQVTSSCSTKRITIFMSERTGSESLQPGAILVEEGGENYVRPVVDAAITA